jgi:hypothetical protein
MLSVQQLNRAMIFLVILLVAPAFAFGFVISAFLALVWLWSKFSAFDHWGMVVGAVCYLSIGAIGCWGFAEVTKPD